MTILMEKPDWARGFGVLMSTWGEGHALLQHLYPVKEKLVGGYDAGISSVLFVDVGGGYGQKSIVLKQAIPDLSGKIIVQDQPMFIDEAPTVDGIEFMAHDFFTEQPVKGETNFMLCDDIELIPSKVPRHIIYVSALMIGLMKPA